MRTTKNVDAYLAHALEEIRDTLSKLRRTIQLAAPQATERISYGMPFYEYAGIGYTGKATYQFPPDRSIPLGLVRKVIRALVKERDRRKRTEAR